MYRALHLHDDSTKHRGFRIPIRTYVSILSVHLRKQLRLVVLLAAALFAGIVLQLINPQIMRSFIDAAKAGAAQTVLLKKAACFLLLAVGIQLFRAVSEYTGQVISWTSTNDLREEVAAHCIRLDMTFHNTHASGELIQRLDGDISLLSGFFSQFAVDLIGSVVFTFGVIGVLFAEDWRLGAVFLIYAILAILALLLMRDIAIPSRKIFQEKIAANSAFLQENLSALEDIRSIGAGDFVLHSYKHHVRRLQRTGEVSNIMGQIMSNGSQIIFTAGTAIAFTAGAWLFLKDAISIGTVYLISHYLALLIHPLQRISSEIQQLQSAGAAIGRTRDLLDRDTAIADSGTVTEIPEAPAIRFENVCFGYSADRDVLTDINITIPNGHSLGILGRTGSGKTTLSRLLFRFYEPRVGTVSIDGVPVDQIDLAYLRSKIGLVTQEVQLFRGSLRDNVSFFDDTIDDTQIRSALFELGLERWFNALPEGLDTLLGSGKGGLSGGEAQLVTFARVFLRNPSVVVLDEASSRLDPATEQLIDHAVHRLLEGRTSIIIAHRISTVTRADEIAVLADGRLIEFGARQELESDPSSRFSMLLASGLEGDAHE